MFLSCVKEPGSHTKVPALFSQEKAKRAVRIQHQTGFCQDADLLEIKEQKIKYLTFAPPPFFSFQSLRKCGEDHAKWMWGGTADPRVSSAGPSDSAARVTHGEAREAPLTKCEGRGQQSQGCGRRRCYRAGRENGTCPGTFLTNIDLHFQCRYRIPAFFYTVE